MERYVESSTFGPPSEFITIRDFLKDARASTERTGTILDQLRGDAMPLDDESVEFEPIPDELKETIEAECSLEGMTADAESILDNPKLIDFLGVYHESYKSSSSGGPIAKVKGKVKEPLLLSLEDRLADPETNAANTLLDSVKLAAWKNPSVASFYARTTQHSDRNSLSSVKLNPLSSSEPSSSLPSSSSSSNSVALVTYTFHTRSPLQPFQFRLTSTHIALSSQTLGDIWDNVSCDVKAIPVEQNPDEEGAVRRFLLPGAGGEEGDEEDDEGEAEGGVAFVVEDKVYGDGLAKPDYAEKLKTHVNWKGPFLLSSGGLLHDTKLSELPIRLQRPYWILHSGECEHFLVFTQIRLPHQTDPTSGYPLTIHLSHSSHPICRICATNAAAYSIVGDIRIGEGGVVPVCGPCWGMLGEPVEDEEDGEGRYRVKVVPLGR